MSITEHAEPEKKPRATRRKRTARAAPTKAPDVFAGLTPDDCCFGCNENNCVISCRPYCAHPQKGGLQAIDMTNSDALRRANEAKRKLARMKMR